MSEYTTKIRLKINEFEIECEGQESFLKNDLSNVLASLSNYFKENNVKLSVRSSLPPEKDVDSTEKVQNFDFSTATIASHIKAKSGPDLAIAASAFLTLVQNKETFTREEIHNEMKKAKNRYTKNMGSNLSKSLENLMKHKRLNETATNVYALTVTERSRLENLLD